MNSSQKTKKALMLSIVSILVCVLMLIGSTFAWFTDTESSGANRIRAGSLDVSLKHKVNNLYKEVDNDTILFNINLWEPGAMAYETFVVSNNGDLALKYTLKMEIGRFNTVNDTGKSLKDVLKVAVIEGEWNGTRNDAKKIAFDKTLESNFKEEILTQKGNSNIFTVFVYWEPSSADNDYNLKGDKTSSDGNALSIDLGINLYASQYALENDSFGNDYDIEYKDVGTAEELERIINSIKEGEGVRLTNNIELTTAIPKKIAGTTIIDLNEHTLKSTVSGGTIVQANEKMIIKNGKLECVLVQEGVGDIITQPTIGIENGGSIILEDVEYTSPNASGLQPYGNGSSVKVVNSTITTKGYPISTNVNAVNNNNIQIDIKNSTISANPEGIKTAVLINIPCRLNVDNSQISGFLHGLIVRGGIAVIKNSTITNTVSNEIPHLDDTGWADGNKVTLGALVIGNNKPGYYLYPSKVTLINTIVEAKSTGGIDSKFPAVYIIGNTEEGLGATIDIDSASTIVGKVIKGNNSTIINLPENSGINVEG